MPGPASYPEAYRNVLKLRVVRQFQDQPLSDPHLHAILEAGRWTGSSKNRQAWSIVVITNPDIKESNRRMRRLHRPGPTGSPERSHWSRNRTGTSSTSAASPRTSCWPPMPSGSVPVRSPSIAPTMPPRCSGSPKAPVVATGWPWLSTGESETGPARRPQTPGRIRPLGQLLTRLEA